MLNDATHPIRLAIRHERVSFHRVVRMMRLTWAILRPIEPSVDDAKIRVLARITSPSRVDSIDSRGTGSLLCPHVQLSDARFLTLGEQLDAAVTAVLHPTTDTQPARFALCRGPKEHALYAATDQHVKLFQGHFNRIEVLANPRWLGNREMGMRTRYRTRVPWAFRPCHRKRDRTSG
jgi:hypothetical protein